MPCSIDSERLPLRSSQTYTQPVHRAMRSSLPRRCMTIGSIPRRTAWKMISASLAVRTRMFVHVTSICSGGRDKQPNASLPRLTVVLAPSLSLGPHRCSQTVLGGITNRVTWEFYLLSDSSCSSTCPRECCSIMTIESNIQPSLTFLVVVRTRTTIRNEQRSITFTQIQLHCIRS
jgi:hypothetical protein